MDFPIISTDFPGIDGGVGKRGKMLRKHFPFPISPCRNLDGENMDAKIGEWNVHVIPWVNYTEAGEGWISLNVRRPKDSGRCSFWLSHNGSRFARGPDFYAAPDWGLPIDDLARYMQQVWGR